MKFAYHWRDEKGITHLSTDRQEADKALHDGHVIFLVMVDKQHKNGTDRKAM